jgi:uncharacterized membrane protein
MHLLLHPFFLTANVILAIWIMIEFHRRYAGNHPMGFATGIFFFPLFPVVSWILAYRLFSAHKKLVNSERRRLNRIAIRFGAFVFFSVTLVALSVACIAASIWVSEEGMWQVVGMITALLVSALACVALAIRTGIRCSRELRKTAQDTW